MTISTTIIKNSYSGDGSNKTFTYGFKIVDEDFIQVIVKTNSTGAESVRSIGTGSANYAVTGVGEAAGGSVVFVTAPTNLETVILRRSTTQTQALDLIENDNLPANSLENAFDKNLSIIQELQEQLDRSIKLSRANTMTSTEFTVTATDRANKVLSFDASGEIAVAQELGTFKGSSATTTTAAYVVRDIVKGSTTAQLNNIYICIQASPVGTALTNTSYWALIVDAVSAATSQTAAASSATAAASSATAAASSATASANSATAAASSATSAASTLTTFQRQYHGAASSDPSSNLDAGDLYFKTDGSGLKVYNGSAWEDIKPTSSEQTNINALAASAVVADMALLATTDVIADMALLATSDVISDMNTLATSDIISDLNTLATSAIVADLDAVADNISAVNSFADRYRVGTSDPTSSLNEGDLFYNSNSNVLKFYDGSNWVVISAVTSSTITGQTAETSIADNDLILISDTSASGALRKMTKANFVTGLGSASSIADTDSDTQIQVEESSDEDKLRFDTGGTERAVMDSNGIALTTNGGSFIHHNTIANDTTLANQNMLLVGNVAITGTLTIGSNSTVVVI